MRLLLDTHAALWAFADPGRLSPEARAAIVDRSTAVLISAVTAWEVAIKRRLGRLTFDGDVGALGAATGFDELAITCAHAAAVEELPLLHQDPFDRMLVSQARIEGAVLVTRDEMIPRYGIAVLRA